jgi:hypothetical protein
LRGLNTHLQNVSGGRNSKLSREHALEVARTHRHAIGKNRERELPMKILRNPNLKVLNGFHLVSLCGQRDAELSLPSGPAQKQNQLPRHLAGNGIATILLTQASAKSIPAEMPAEV